MQATSTGPKLAGSVVSPQGGKAILDALHEFSSPELINTPAQMPQQVVYIDEPGAVAYAPPRSSIQAEIRTGMKKSTGKSDPFIFLDKIGERIAFECGGTRLYDALITKYQSLCQQRGDRLPSVGKLPGSQAEGSVLRGVAKDETPLETISRIRAEEQSHFSLLCQAMKQLGGDPAAPAPCADIIATGAAGLIQVVTDPRTTLAQCLNAVIAAELIDAAGWELLALLADEAGECALRGRFLGALSQEQQHLAIVQGWLSVLLSEHASPIAA